MAPDPTSFSDELRKDGYSREEEYFYRQNRELIEEHRKRLNELRVAQQAEFEKSPHWLRCPKCGGEMRATDLKHVQIERCTQCEGVYLDRGELELLVHSKEPHAFMNRLKKLFEYREVLPR